MLNTVKMKEDLLSKYELYIGNLSTKATESDLRSIFSEIGDVKRVYVNEFCTSQVTYGFVAFGSIEELENACKKYNGVLIHGRTISVSIAESTANRINAVGAFSRNKNNSISKRSFPRKEGKKYLSTHKDEQEIHMNLRKSLSNLSKNCLPEPVSSHVKDPQVFMKDLKETLVLMSKVAQGVCVDANKFEGVRKDLKELGDLIINYHKTPEDNHEPFKDVDFDFTL